MEDNIQVASVAAILTDNFSKLVHELQSLEGEQRTLRKEHEITTKLLKEISTKYDSLSSNYRCWCTEMGKNLKEVNEKYTDVSSKVDSLSQAKVDLLSDVGRLKKEWSEVGLDVEKLKEIRDLTEIQIMGLKLAAADLTEIITQKVKEINQKESDLIGILKELDTSRYLGTLKPKEDLQKRTEMLQEAERLQQELQQENESLRMYGDKKKELISLLDRHIKDTTKKTRQSFPTSENINDQMKCPICSNNFSISERKRTLFPCTKGIRVLCDECIEQLKAKPVKAEDCVIAGELCDPNLIHVKCPFCSEVTHLLKGIEMLTVNISEADLEEVKHDIQRATEEFLQHERTLSGAISKAANELKKHSRNTKIATGTGIGATIAGGLTALAGIITFIPSFGISTVLIAAGSGVLVAGVVVAYGTFFVGKFIEKSTKAEIESELKKLNHLKIAVINAVLLYGIGCEFSLPSKFAKDVSKISSGYSFSSSEIPFSHSSGFRVSVGVATGVTGIIFPLDLFLYLPKADTLGALSETLLQTLQEVQGDDQLFRTAISHEVMKCEKLNNRIFPAEVLCQS